MKLIDQLGNKFHRYDVDRMRSDMDSKHSPYLVMLRTYLPVHNRVNIVFNGTLQCMGQLTVDIPILTW